MSEESTLEDKILTIVILFFCFGFGFWVRSVINNPLLDGLVLIATIASGVLMVIASVLLSMGETE